MKMIFEDERGVVTLESVIMIPLLLMILLATIEFGNYFMREYAVSRSVSAAASYIQTVSPNNSQQDATYINTQLQSVISDGGMGNVSSTSACALATPVKSTSDCGITGAASDYRAGRFNAGVTPSSPYWVQIRASVPYSTITGVKELAGINFPTLIGAKADVLVAPAIPTTPSASCSSSQSLTYDKDTNSLVCKGISASGSWKQLNLQDQTTLFNLQCEYRIYLSSSSLNVYKPFFDSTVGPTIIYADVGAGGKAIIGAAHSGAVSGSSYQDKSSWMWVDASGNKGSLGSGSITKIEERCP